MKFTGFWAALLVLVSCTTAAPPSDAPPPWAAPPITDVPAVYRAEWQKAANRDSCALVAFSGTAAADAATPRRANFSGGWAVAYDTPSQRSAFGIAGTGSSGSGPTYDQWPHRLIWNDGSRAEYGLEGGTGPRHLAYVWIAGQDCLYNVWSQGGREHLEELLRQIRFVR